MSLSKIVPYIQKKMDAIGYVEHSDEFDLNNVPSTKLDKSYSLQMGSMSPSSASMVDYTWSAPMDLYVFLNGYSKPSEAMIDAIEKASSIMDELFAVEDRYSLEGVRSFRPTGLDFEKYADDADHIILIKIGIEATVNIFNSKNC